MNRAARLDMAVQLAAISAIEEHVGTLTLSALLRNWSRVGLPKRRIAQIREAFAALNPSNPGPVSTGRYFQLRGETNGSPA